MTGDYDATVQVFSGQIWVRTILASSLSCLRLVDAIQNALEQGILGWLCKGIHWDHQTSIYNWWILGQSGLWGWTSVLQSRFILPSYPWRTEVRLGYILKCWMILDFCYVACIKPQCPPLRVESLSMSCIQILTDSALSTGSMLLVGHHQHLMWQPR